MPRALNLHQDTSNNHLLMGLRYHNYSCINLPYRQGPNQVDSSIDLQDEMILAKVVTRPTEKPRGVGPHKLILEKSKNKRKSRLENKKFKIIIKPLYGISADHNDNNGLKPPRYLLYKNEDENKYPLVDTSTSIPIVSWKITKKRPHIISDISILSHYHILNSVTGSN